MAGNHPSNFMLPIPPIQACDGRRCPAAVNGFGDHEVDVPMGGDLRQVGNAEHLIFGSKTLEPAPDHVRRVSTDPGIDLVENESGISALLCRDGLDGEHQSRQFSA